MSYNNLTREEARVGHAVAHLQTKEGEPPTTTEVARETRIPPKRVYTILHSAKFQRFIKPMKRGRDKIYQMSPEMKVQFLVLGTLIAGVAWLGYSQYAHEKAAQNRMLYQQHMSQQEFDKLMLETSRIQENQAIIAGNQIYLNGQLRQVNYNLEGIGAQQRYVIQQNNLILDNQGVLYTRQGEIYGLVDQRTGEILRGQAELARRQTELGETVGIRFGEYETTISEQETTQKTLEDDLADALARINSSITSKTTSSKSEEKTKTTSKSITEHVKDVIKTATEQAKKEPKKEEKKESKPWSGLIKWL